MSHTSWTRVLKHVFPRCAGIAGTRQVPIRSAFFRLRVEQLEDRTVCSADLLTGVGAIGDSTTAERGGNNWTEQLAVGRGINFGPSNSVTVGGVAFQDYAYVLSGSPQTMLNNAAVATLAGQVANGSVRLVYLDGIGVDFAQRYAAIYRGTLAGPQLATFIAAEVASVRAAMDTLSAAGNVKFVLENVGDFGGTPFVVQNVGNFLGLQPGAVPDPAKKQLFTDAIRAANIQIQQLADQRGVPVVDQFGWGSRLTDANNPPVLGGLHLDIAPTFTQVTSLRVTDPLRLFIDSQHLGPVAQGVKANVFLAAVREAYGADVAPFTDQEILTYAYARAGLAPPVFTGTTYYDVAGLVRFNHPPVASNFGVTATTTATAISVLAHSTDPNGDRLAISSVTQGQNGTVTIQANGTVTYTLTRFFAGVDTFSYNVSDGRGGTATGTVTVNVQVPPIQGILLIRSQLEGLDLSPGSQRRLNAKLRAAENLLNHGQARAAALSLKAFIINVRVLERIGRLEPATSDFLVGEAQAVIGLLPSPGRRA